MGTGTMTSKRASRLMSEKGKDTITSKEAFSFIGWVKKMHDPDSISLVSFVIKERLDGIEAETDEGKRLERAIDLFDFVKRGFVRQNYRETIGEIDYRNAEHYPISEKVGLAGKEMGDCPVCGKRGEITPPYPPRDYPGSTIHVCEPFFMGLSIVNQCEWPVVTASLEYGQ